MGRLNTFEIFLLNQYGEVEAGSILRGQVILECSEDMEIKEIDVHCFGKCRVQWVDTRAAAPLAEVQAGITPPVTAEENYINEYFKCFPIIEENKPEQTVSHTLPKGLHTFDFAFRIPSSAPASFATDHGFIKYVVRAQVHLQNKVEQNIRYFTVRPVFDLNRIPNVEECIEKQDEVEVTSLLRNWGKCKAKVMLPKKGFVHGEAIPITLMINNESSKELSRARVRLRMVTKYTIKSQSCTGDKILAESKLAPITAGYTFNSCDRCLQIPKDIPASHLQGCKFMHVKYYVELYIRPTLLSVKKLRIAVKIHVGTKPISAAREQAYLRMREAPPKYDDLPPSYRDAIRLQLSEISQNEMQDSNDGGSGSSPSEKHSECPTSNSQCPNSQNNNEPGASCANTTCSDAESLCSSLDSLISKEDSERENMKVTEISQSIKLHQSLVSRQSDFLLSSGAENLRIAVLRRNLSRTSEELTIAENQNYENSSCNTSHRLRTKKSFASAVNSFFSAFPFFICQDMKR